MVNSHVARLLQSIFTERRDLCILYLDGLQSNMYKFAPIFVISIIGKKEYNYRKSERSKTIGELIQIPK